MSQQETPTLTPPDKSSLVSSGSYERRPLAPPPKFKKADLNESLRSIISSSTGSYGISDSAEVPRGKFLLEHEKEASEGDLLEKGKTKISELSASNNTISSNQHIYDSDDSPAPRRRGYSQPRPNEIAMTAFSNSPTFHVNNNNNNNNNNNDTNNNNNIKNINNIKNTRSNSVSSDTSVGSSDSLLSHHPLSPNSPSPSLSSSSLSSLTSSSSKSKKKSLLAAIFFSKSGKTESADTPAIFPEELEEKPKSFINQHANFTTKERKLYTRKPFQKVESFQTVKDKKYKTILEDQRQRVLTEVPRMVEHQLVEEAYPIILKMCQEYIKNLGEKHEITLTAIDKLKQMANFLGRECEFGDDGTGR